MVLTGIIKKLIIKILEMIWITSDTHFNHNKLIDWGCREEGFNEDIIKRWNNTVVFKPKDTVIFLGDFMNN